MKCDQCGDALLSDEAQEYQKKEDLNLIGALCCGRTPKARERRRCYPCKVRGGSE